MQGTPKIFGLQTISRKINNYQMHGTPNIFCLQKTSKKTK